MNEMKEYIIATGLSSYGIDAECDNIKKVVLVGRLLTQYAFLYPDNQVSSSPSCSSINKQRSHRGKFRHPAILAGVAHLFFGHSARVGQTVNSAGGTMLQEVPKSAVAWVCVLVRPSVVHDHVEQ
jgi:hypothetical protein